MRQSTLLFGGGSGSRVEAGQRESVEKDEDAVDTNNPPSKKPRRAAAGRSEELSKHQIHMQTTLAQDGKLNRKPTVESKRISSETDNGRAPDQHVDKKQKEKSSEPISLSVKGTMSDPTQAHSFFAKRHPAAVKEEKEAVSFSTSLTAFAKQKWPQQKEAPWPDSTSIHVQPDDSHSQLFSKESLIQRPRRKRVQSSLAEEKDLCYPWTANKIASSSSSSSRADVKEKECRKDVGASSIESEKMSAALQRLHKEVLDGTNTSDDTLWVDRWRPIRADQVLGNETRALYLRDWLKELEVTAEVKAGKVIKRVEKRKKKSKREDLDGFIVEDEDEEEAWFDHFRKHTAEQFEVDDGLDTQYKSDDRKEHLMNAIVLQGPTGSGKTAAVYACAAELGFEDFEIYPGSGRRSGKDIGQAVGNLGRNHMVSSGGTGGGATWKGSKVAKPMSEAGNPRQSLILLEEVDLLYEDDKGFWAAVVDLVSTSRRPVVMTCNDLNCIPFGMLPIQDVLVFEAPNEAQASSYLRMMALCDNHQLPKALEYKLYQNTAGDLTETSTTSQWTVPASGPLHLGTSLANADKMQGTYSSPDLRQAIMQLQYLCQGGLPEDDESVTESAVTPAMEISRHLKAEIEEAERRSICDAFLNRPFERASEIQEPDEYENSINDVQVLSAIILKKARVKMEVTTLAMLGREEEYHNVILANQDLSHYPQGYDQRRWRESQRVNQLMNSIMLSECFMMPSWVPIVEIGPLVANMIRSDDDEQAAYQTRLNQVLRNIQENFDVNGSKSLDTAGKSLLEIGIRPTRHNMRILLAKGGDGTLALSKKEIAPCRWFELGDDVLNATRNSFFTM